MPTALSGHGTRFPIDTRSSFSLTYGGKHAHPSSKNVPVFSLCPLRPSVPILEFPRREDGVEQKHAEDAEEYVGVSDGGFICLIPQTPME